MRTFPGHTGFIEALAFSPDGRFLATASADGSACLWDVVNAKLVAVVHKSNKVQLGAIAYSPDGRWLAVGDYHGHICVYNTKDLREARDWKGRGRVVGLAFAPSGRYLAWASYSEVGWGLFPGDGGSHLLDLRHTKPFALAISPDSETLAIGHQADHFSLCPVATMERRTFPHGKERGCWTLTFSPDGQSLALALGEGVQLWDMAAGQVRAKLGGHEDVVAGIAYAPDGKRLASCSWDGTVRLYNVETATPQPLASYDWKLGRLFCVAFSLDGTLAAVGGDKGDYLLAWDVE